MGVQKTFNEGKQPIRIRVGEQAISFHYPNKSDKEFFGPIPVTEWRCDIGHPDGWSRLLMKKKWFTDEMYNFLNDIICGKEKIA